MQTLLNLPANTKYLPDLAITFSASLLMTTKLGSGPYSHDSGLVHGPESLVVNCNVYSGWILVLFNMVLTQQAQLQSGNLQKTCTYHSQNPLVAAGVFRHRVETLPLVYCSLQRVRLFLMVTGSQVWGTLPVLYSLDQFINLKLVSSPST